MSKLGVIFGYSQDWYEKLKPVIPRKYHKYLWESSRQRLYSDEQLGELDAYFASYPKTYKVLTYGGARVKYSEVNEDGKKLTPCNSKDTELCCKKIPQIYNNGKKGAYVRVHLAIPDCLDSGDPEFDASSNLLHFNTEKNEALAIGAWNFATTMENHIPNNYVSGGKWNYYQVTIGHILYNVYVATYESILAAGEKLEGATQAPMYQCYLDPKASARDCVKVNEILRTNKWEIKVAVEAIAAVDGVENGIDAFADKVPGTYNVFE